MKPKQVPAAIHNKPFILHILTHNKIPEGALMCAEINPYMVQLLPILTQDKTVGVLMCANTHRLYMEINH